MAGSNDIQLPVIVQGLLYQVVPALHRGYGLEVGCCCAALTSDFVHHLSCGRLIGPGAVHGRARIVDYHLCPLLG